MKVTRSGGMVTVLLPGAGNAVVCSKCGFPFRPTRVLSDGSCPRCGAPGPFRKATEADFSAYVESRRPKPSDYWKALGLAIVVFIIVAIITKWVVDA